MAKPLGSEGFGQRLKKARLQYGANRVATLSQAELGKLMDVSGVTVGRWEDGTREPSLALLEELATVLGVTPCWLAFGLGYETMPHDNGNGKGYDYEDQTEFIPDPREKSRRKRA